jgi:hypothetical protein
MSIASALNKACGNRRLDVQSFGIGQSWHKPGKVVQREHHIVGQVQPP